MTLKATCGACGTCQKCHLASRDKRYAELFGLPFKNMPPQKRTGLPPAPAGPPLVKVSLPCIFRGEDELSGPQRQEHGLSHAKHWFACNHPKRPLDADYICPCSGCGERCSGYDDGTLPWHAGSAEFLRNLSPYPVGRWAGRGVVIAGGGPYWPSVYVTVRMLRHVGCKLPVQVWYFEGERDERYEKLLAPLGVAFVNADAHRARAGRRMIRSFGIKLFAVVNSPFEEVLSLDADNYPCADPTALFEDQRYAERGGIYWPDRTHTNAWTKWPFWGVEKFGPNCGFETGQYVLHKHRAYEPMALAEWYDDHGDSCYATNNSGVLSGGGDYGDKGPHRVAWARLRREPVVFGTEDSWKECGFIQAGPDSRTPMFVHRCQGKIVLDESRFPTTPQVSVNKRYGFPMEREAFSFLDELRDAMLTVPT